MDYPKNDFLLTTIIFWATLLPTNWKMPHGLRSHRSRSLRLLNIFPKVSQFKEQLSSASLVCLDGNIPASTIDYVCSITSKHNVHGIGLRRLGECWLLVADVCLACLTQCGHCVPQSGMSPQMQTKLVSLFSRTPGSHWLIRPQTWLSFAPWQEHLVFPHLMVNTFPSCSVSVGRWAFLGIHFKSFASV